MNPRLFRRIGIFFAPSSVVGWLVLLAAVAFLVWKFIDIDSRSHSVSDTLMNFFFMALIVGVVYSLIGFFGSPRSLE
jgi:putative effector of murein hydrolase LrgA (UPF0299 family)